MESTTLYLGLTIEDDGFQFLGIDTVNEHLAQGWSLAEVGSGDLVLVPTGKRAASGEKYSLAGWKIALTLTR